ncbi:hypothetical protein BS50DRAFT_582982 [Corynespora cassiicola Philippines]|uniref:Transcription factor domain-containing protein n=1 Tax=Corynespora cassiicola Philippines TaxID=1448308 RepID=A0A2T2P754_CORCC|nr:hypothetical protein BS50DRAFT_582982 [Corynespora cassiicola Philippines]
MAYQVQPSPSVRPSTRLTQPTRLSVSCLYPDADTSHDTETSPGQSGTRIDEILERLSNIESHIGLSNSDTNPNSTPSGLTQSLASSNRAIPDDWKISPGNLHPDSLGMVTYGSLVRVQREKNTPLATFINKYFSYTHFWLPMVRRRKLDTEFENLDTLIIEGNDDYKIVFLAMHLLVSDKIPGDTSSSYDYRACKYHFGHYLTLKKPYVHLIQAGMMIALYEHMQSIEDRAVTTLGICARLAYTLNLDRLVAEISYRAKADLSAEEEEAVLTWWGLSLLDRYFSMNPAKAPHHPCIPLFYDGGDHVATNSAGIPTTAFHTVDKETIESVSIELVSASLLGRVQLLIRKSLFGKNSKFPESSTRIMRDIDSYLQMLKQKTASDGSWSGHAVCYRYGDVSSMLTILKLTKAIKCQTSSSMSQGGNV